MKIRMLAALLLALSLLISSCGIKLKGSGASTGGQNTEDYFSQMAYIKSSPGESGPSRYLAPADSPPLILQSLSGGKNIYLDIAVFLNKKDRHYTFVYDESVGCNNGHGIVKYKFHHKFYEGLWTASSSGITLDQYAIGQGNQNGDQLGLNLKFLKDLHMAGLAHHSTQLVYRDMPTSISDVKNDGYITDYDYAIRSLDSSGLCKP